MSEKADAAVQSASAPAAYERRMAGCSNSMSGSSLMVVAWVSLATSSSVARESLMLALYYYIMHIIIPRSMCTLAHAGAEHPMANILLPKPTPLNETSELLQIRRNFSTCKLLEADFHYCHLAQGTGQRSDPLAKCCQKRAPGVADLQPRNFVRPARYPSVFANPPTSRSTPLLRI